MNRKELLPIIAILTGLSELAADVRTKGIIELGSQESVGRVEVRIRELDVP